jgi:hypothetical protein
VWVDGDVAATALTAEKSESNLRGVLVDLQGRWGGVLAEIGTGWVWSLDVVWMVSDCHQHERWRMYMSVAGYFHV